MTDIVINGGNPTLNLEPRLGGMNTSLLMRLSCSSNNEQTITYRLVANTVIITANSLNIAPVEPAQPGTPAYYSQYYLCAPPETETETLLSNVIVVSDGSGGSNSIGARVRTYSMNAEYTFIYNTSAIYEVNLDGGNKLYTYFTPNNDTKIVNITHRNVVNNVADVNCVNIVVVTGNTIWDYAPRTNLNAQLFTQTYMDGAQIVTINNRTVTLNIAQGHTFLVTTGQYFPNLNNHHINTLNIIKPSTPDELSLNFTMILANVKNVTTTAWRNAGVRWPAGQAAISLHLPDGSGPCGTIDVYSFLNFYNLRDYFSTNTYTINVINGNAATGNLFGWTSNGNVRVRSTNPVARSGSGDYFMMGNSAFSWARQDVDLTDEILLIDIDKGNANANISWYQAGASGDGDQGALQLRFMNGSTFLANTSVTRTQYDPTWVYRSVDRTVPAGTRKIRIEMESARVGGTNNDSYFDDISNITITRLRNDANAPRITSNTIQSNIWYGFEPFRRKRTTLENEINIAVLLRGNPGALSRIQKWEWERYRTLYGARQVHIICVDTNPGVPGATYPFPSNLYDDIYGAVQPKVYYTDADFANPNDAVDWFTLLDIPKTEACTGSYIRLFGRSDMLCPTTGYVYHPNRLRCSEFGASFGQFVDTCALYNISVVAAIEMAGGPSDVWISGLQSNGEPGGVYAFYETVDPS